MVHSPKSNPDGFERRLQAQVGTANKDFEQTIESRIDTSVRATSDAGTVVEENLKRIFRGKTKELTEQVLEIRRRQAGEVRALSDAVLLKKHELAVLRLDRTSKTAMELSGGETNKIATPEELVHFAKTGLRMLEQTDTSQLLHMDNAGNELAPDELKETYLEVLNRLHDNPRILGSEDAEFIAKEVRELTRIVSADQLPEGDAGLGIVLLAYLSPAQRLGLMRHMMQEPGTYDLITDLVKLDYLSSAQAETLFTEELARLEAASEKARRKDRKAMEAQALDLEENILKVNSKKTKQTQKQVRKMKKRANRTAKRRSFGHKNRAKELFSLKGMAGALLIANGSMTIAANTLANLYSPLDIVGNPYLGLGVVMTAGGLELTDGYHGLAPTVTKGMASLVKEKEEIDEEKKTNSIRDMRRSLTNNRLASKFYYKNADKIVNAYHSNKRANPDGNVHISLKDLGINPDSPEYAEAYGTISQTEMEGLLSQWAKYFFTTGLGEKQSTERLQRRFVNAAYSLEGLAEFTLDKPSDSKIASETVSKKPIA